MKYFSMPLSDVPVQWEIKTGKSLSIFKACFHTSYGQLCLILFYVDIYLHNINAEEHHIVLTEKIQMNHQILKPNL